MRRTLQKPKPATAARRPFRASGAGRGTAARQGRLLTTAQKTALAIEARRAWDYQRSLGLAGPETGQSDTAAFCVWRHAQVLDVCGCAGLTDAGNDNFRAIRARFLLLQGRDVPAFEMQLRTGRTRDHAAPEDTHEARERMRAVILGEFRAHGDRLAADPALAARVAEKGGLIHAGYALALAKAKFPRTAPADLSAAQLGQILYTVRNRIAAREGRGSTATRNKSQRRQGGANA
jgi:hypothetical protein